LLTGDDDGVVHRLRARVLAGGPVLIAIPHLDQDLATVRGKP
jgi:hypothetical protein